MAPAPGASSGRWTPLRTGPLVVAIFELSTWGEYLITLTLVDFPELETIAIADETQAGRPLTSDVVASYGTEAAAYVVAMLPVILVFVLMQKWFVRGLSEGILRCRGRASPMEHRRQDGWYAWSPTSMR